MTPHDLFFAEMNVRFHRVLQALHIPHHEWLLATSLLPSDRPVSENSLALILDLPRTTLRPYVLDAIDMGFVRRSAECFGIEMTSTGWHLAMEILRQGTKIAQGEQDGFNDSVIRPLIEGQKKSRRRKGRVPSASKLRNLRFRPKLFTPVEIRQADA